MIQILQLYYKTNHDNFNGKSEMLDEDEIDDENVDKDSMERGKSVTEYSHGYRYMVHDIEAEVTHILKAINEDTREHVDTELTQTCVNQVH